MVESLAGVWVRSRERDADFDRLFLEQYGTVVAIAQRVLGDAHEAEDVAQDVFCAYYRAHSPSAPYAAPWLHRAAAHAALNMIRGRRRRARREIAQEAQRERLTPHATPDPQDVVTAAEERREVQDALARLPRKSAEALILRYSGLSYAEVGAALGIRASGVGTLLRRAESALRKEMSRGTSR